MMWAWSVRGRSNELVHVTIIRLTFRLRNDVSSIIDTGKSEEKTQVLPTGVEPVTFWLLVQMLYHWATGDSWELRPLNQVHVTNILHTARIRVSIGGIFARYKCDGEFWAWWVNEKRCFFNQWHRRLVYICIYFKFFHSLGRVPRMGLSVLFAPSSFGHPFYHFTTIFISFECVLSN